MLWCCGHGCWRHQTLEGHGCMVRMESTKWGPTHTLSFKMGTRSYHTTQAEASREGLALDAIKECFQVWHVCVLCRKLRSLAPACTLLQPRKNDAGLKKSKFESSQAKRKTKSNQPESRPKRSQAKPKYESRLNWAELRSNTRPNPIKMGAVDYARPKKSLLLSMNSCPTMRNVFEQFSYFV